MTDAEESNVILNVIDVWNLSTVGATVQSKSKHSGCDATADFDGRLRMISEATADQLQDMSRVSKIRFVVRDRTGSSR